MARGEPDADATRSPTADKARRGKRGAKFGLPRKEDVVAVVRRIARPDHDWYAHGRDYR